MKLSTNFTLSELTKSQTAIRLGIDNTSPNDTVIRNLKTLSEHVLQPVRDHFGRVDVNSGYRCLELNRALHSKDTSQHVTGNAADIEISGVTNLTLAQWIRDNLTFDQVILEYWYPDEGGNSGWVHVSYSDRNRKQALVINKNGTSYL